MNPFLCIWNGLVIFCNFYNDEVGSFNLKIYVLFQFGELGCQKYVMLEEQWLETCVFFCANRITQSCNFLHQ